MTQEHDFKRFPELTNSQMRVFYLESPHFQITRDFEASVVKVTDGDTIRVTMENRDFSFPVRFLDIQAPELDEEGGLESKEWLSDLVMGEDVIIEIDPSNRVGKWGRILGRVILSGLNINELSLLERMSIPFEESQDAFKTTAEA